MTKFLKIKKLVSRHTKGFQAINEHMLLQNCGEEDKIIGFTYAENYCMKRRKGGSRGF